MRFGRAMGALFAGIDGLCVKAGCHALCHALWVGNFERPEDVKLGKLSIFLKQFDGQLQSEESVETKCR